MSYNKMTKCIIIIILTKKCIHHSLTLSNMYANLNFINTIKEKDTSVNKEEKTREEVAIAIN